MVDYTYESLFYEDSVDKQLKIVAEDGTVITNEDIVSESMKIDEGLCSEQSLTFGSCEASEFTITIANRFSSLVGQWIEVSITPANHTEITGEPDILGESELGEAVLGYDGVHQPEVPFVIGTFKVQSDKPTADREYREIIAYDAMYDIINADGTDIAEWYNTVFPTNSTKISVKNFRKSFLEHFGINVISTSLVNDDIRLEKTISTSALSGQRVIKAICEINGVFGHITRDGKFEYVQLDPINEADAYDIPFNKTSDYEDFETNVINSLQIRENDTDPGSIYGSGDNRYIINGNFLIYGKTTSELNTIAANLYPIINKITYRPASMDVAGNPCLEVGDVVHLSTKYQEIYTYILTRTLSGIQALSDSYYSDGVETYVDQGGDIDEDIEQLRSRTAELASEVDTQQERLNVVVETIEADYAEFLDLVVDVANIHTLFAEYATIQELYAALATIDELYVTYEEVETLLVGYASIDDLEAVRGTITLLDSDIANIINLLAGNAGVGDLEAIRLTTANAIIDEAVITDALINTVLAGIITSNIIYTDEITIMSENGGIIIAGTTMQFSDSNGTVRLQLGEDADGNFTFVLYDETGTGIMIDSEGIHASAVPDGLIVDSMVADDAAISGYKLNIEEVTQILNEQGQLTLNAAQVTIDGETLDYRLSQITQQISDIEAMGVESIVNYYALGSADEPPCEPGETTNNSILGEMILGEALLGYVGWTTERLVASEGEYLWYSQKITYVDGTVVWTTPTLITDDWIRSTVETTVTELSVIQGQIESKVWESDIINATNSIWEQLTVIDERYADIVVSIANISATVSEVITTESDHYLSLSSEIANITIDIGTITSTVESVQQSIENIESYAVTNTTMEYYKSTSITECVGGEWSTTAPQAEEGYYIWMRVSITYGVGSESRVVTTDPICLTALGEENFGVVSIEPYYSVSESPEWYQPHNPEYPALVGTAIVGSSLVDVTGEWTTEQPEINEYEYLWETFLVTYSNGDTTWTEPTCLTDIVLKEQVQNLQESYSQIEQTIDSITLTVHSTSGGALGSTASIVMTVGDEALTADLDLSNVREAFADDDSQIIISAGEIIFNSGTLVINSEHFILDSSGNLTINTNQFSLTTEGIASFSGELSAPHGNIGGWTIGTSSFYYETDSISDSTNLGIYIGRDGFRFNYTRSSTVIRNSSIDLIGESGSLEIIYNTVRLRPDDNLDTYGNGGVDITSAGFWLYSRTGEGSLFTIQASPNGGGSVSSYLELYWRDEANFYGQVYSTYEIIVTSDRALKQNIESLDNKYIEMLDAIEPVRFKYKCCESKEDNTDGIKSYHIGYIAQDVISAAKEAGLAENEVGFYSKDKGDGYSGLSYGEIIPLLHLKIKQLESRIEQLEQAD